MGSAFCTVAEAAARLGKSKRTIWTYIDKGFLKRNLRDGKVHISRDEVEQLALELGTDFPTLSRKTFYELQSKVKALEVQMAMVQATWGASEAPLRPSEKEAAGMHKAATDYLCTTTWTYDELVNWSKIFPSIDETTLNAVAKAALTMKPWEAFYSLAERMLEFVSASKNLKTTLALQALKHALEQGRVKVREAALLWIETGKGSIPNEVFRLFDTPKEDLVRRLVRPNGKSPQA